MFIRGVFARAKRNIWHTISIFILKINSPLCGSQKAAGVRSQFSFHSDLEEDDNIECDEDFEPTPEDIDSHVQDMNFYARLHNGEDEQTYQVTLSISF